MEKEIELFDILLNVQKSEIDIETAKKKILDLFNTKISQFVEEPILVGKLNKVFGYNGFKPVEIGTDVFEFKDRYYFEITPLNDEKPIIYKFYKETLKPCINFL